MNITSLKDLPKAASTVHAKSRIEIYIKGSSHGNPGPSGWGFVAVLFNAAGTPIATAERSAAGSAITTNNRAELAAVLNALNFVREREASGVWPFCPVLVCSGSEYVLKGIAERLAKWLANGWHLAKGKAAKNRDLWERFTIAAEGMPLECRWVPRHSQNRWNVRAVELASNAALAATRSGVSFRTS